MRKAACILLVNNGYFLAVSLKHDKNDFNLPGGKVEPFESFKNAAIRELKEETGIIVLNKDLVLLHQDYDIGLNNKTYFVKTFFSKLYSGYIHTNETGIVKWLPLKKLDARWACSKTWIQYNSTVYHKYNKIS